MCSFDPGDRTFQTIYDPSSNHLYDIGAGDRSGIIKYCDYCPSIDRLISKQAQEKQSKKRSSLKRAIRRMRIRLQNRVDEVHKQLAKFLVINYDLILLPSFETSQMVVKVGRKIRSQTVRSMLTWSHYRFKQRLLFKCNIMLRSALSTKRTRLSVETWIGVLKAKRSSNAQNQSVGWMVMDGDANAAKNIFLKNMQVLGISVSPTLGPTPVQSSDCCTETEMSSLNFGKSWNFRRVWSLE